MKETKKLLTMSDMRRDTFQIMIADIYKQLMNAADHSRRQRWIATLLFIVSTIFLGGCGTSDELSRFYEPEAPGFTNKPYPASYVEMLDGSFDKKQSTPQRKQLIAAGYFYVGCLEFAGPIPDSKRIRAFAGKIGAELVVKRSLFVGKKQGTRMVLDRYTPGQVFTSSASAYGHANSSGSGEVYGPRGTSTFNTTGSANSYATGSSTTFVPGQSTYKQEEFEYPVYAQLYSFWVSPQGVRRNWDKFREYCVMKRGIRLPPGQQGADEFIASSKSRADKIN